MHKENLLFEHYDKEGNTIHCHTEGEDKLHVLTTKNAKLLHTISRGRMRVFINNKRQHGGKEYAELFFFPIRDSRAIILVEEGNNMHEVPYHVIMNEGTFFGHTDETLEKKIYLPVETLRRFRI